MPDDLTVARKRHLVGNSPCLAGGVPSCRPHTGSGIEDIVGRNSTDGIGNTVGKRETCTGQQAPTLDVTAPRSLRESERTDSECPERDLGLDLDHAFIRSGHSVGFEDRLTERVALRRQTDSVALPGELVRFLVGSALEDIARRRWEHAPLTDGSSPPLRVCTCLLRTNPHATGGEERAAFRLPRWLAVDLRVQVDRVFEVVDTAHEGHRRVRRALTRLDVDVGPLGHVIHQFLVGPFVRLDR